MRNAWASSYWRFFNTCVILEVDLLEAEETFLLLFPGFSVLLLAKTIAVLANSFEKCHRPYIVHHQSDTARTNPALFIFYWDGARFVQPFPGATRNFRL